MTKLRRPAVALILVMLLMSALTTSALSEANTETTVFEIPFETEAFVPCANGGNGETVYITGTLKGVGHVTQDSTGTYHVESVYIKSQATGIGSITGDEYLFVGTNFLGERGSVTTPPWIYTNEGSSILIGQGTASNALFHLTYHFTLNANGEYTASVANQKVECR